MYPYLLVFLASEATPRNSAAPLNDARAPGHTYPDNNPGFPTLPRTAVGGRPFAWRQVARRENSMKGSMKGFAIVWVLGLAGCTYERYDDCSRDRDDEDGFGNGASSHAGKDNVGGSRAAGGTSGGGGSGPATGGAGREAPPTCTEERDCEAGYNCNAETSECEPSEQETCSELDSEAACSNRRDCEPVYGGLNCSCGADCECEGGEPGCVCESFEFFACRALE
jgi:hypothetical protein